MSEFNDWPAPDPIQAGGAAWMGQSRVLGQEPLANFAQRLLARILDSLNVFVLYISYTLIVAFLLTATNVADDAPIATLLTSAGFLVFVGLQVYWEGKGGSPFRRGYGVWIVDATTGQPIGVPRAILRILVANFSLLAFGLGYLWMLWDPKNQTWHDKAARTLVVKR